MTAHLGDDATLYALGALDPREAAAVEAHLGDCEACRAEVAAAEDDVARIVAAQPQHAAPAALELRVRKIFERAGSFDRPRTVAWPAFGAVAAALLIGLLPSLWLWTENRSMNDAFAQQTAAMNRVATAPHLTAEFDGMPQPSKAMVMYAPSGAWYVIVVRNASKTLHVAWMHDGERTMLGDAVAHDGTAMLYLPKSHRMEQLALMDGSQVVAQAALRYE